MEWDWNFVWQIMPTLIDGLRITILATVLGAAVAAVVGLVFAILRMTAPKPVARMTGFIVEFIRGTPLLVQLYFIFYVLPDIGIRLPALLAGRSVPSLDDIRAVAPPVLRHRILLNFQAEADGVDSDQVIGRLLEHVRS